MAAEVMSDPIVRYTLRDTTTGDERTGTTSGKGYESSDNCHWHWTEGNYSCDRARGQFFAESNGELDPDLPCGDGRFELVALWLDDKELV